MRERQRETERGERKRDEMGEKESEREKVDRVGEEERYTGGEEK